ncbi:NAD(P)-binding protein [Hypoxylon trugodes]|uniref:NAD(P)-binding protein n=1 Tax=Hypoxylon trugodes TaxID=326681 RepID=UPI0021901ECA|nr:NAD(P)-binding protein [Hypoxylon trugodes]KAI1392412.1 NAD(P)-binding protein [Hypoxylon trugodes]
MSNNKRTVLITGCSDGGLGAALAIAFQKAGLHVYATARDTSKMANLKSLGIETMALDVLSDSSIAACVKKLSSLDILVNNAGQYYPMTAADIDIAEAKKAFDINVWAHIAVTQAFLPLLVKSSDAMIVFNTSAASVVPIPFQVSYNASKAALAMFAYNMRFELEPFGIKVIDLRGGLIKSDLVRNMQQSRSHPLPPGSIYEPARELIEKAMRREGLENEGTPAHEWAGQVVQDLLKKSPPSVIWRGATALAARIAAVVPFGLFDGTIRKLNGLDVVGQVIQKASKEQS